MRIFAVAIVALSLPLAACGSSSSSQGPGDVAAEFAHALGAGDADKACSLMSPTLQREAFKDTHAKSCAAGWKSVLDSSSGPDKKRLKNARVKSVRVKGEWADVVFVEQPPGSAPTHMHKVDGKWILDAPPEDRALGHSIEAKAMTRNAVTEL